eukprot:scaffold1070_cov245-Pinguiococcus_pyrenoidosus.AAC.54
MVQEKEKLCFSDQVPSPTDGASLSVSRLTRDDGSKVATCEETTWCQRPWSCNTQDYGRTVGPWLSSAPVWELPEAGCRPPRLSYGFSGAVSRPAAAALTCSVKSAIPTKANVQSRRWWQPNPPQAPFACLSSPGARRGSPFYNADAVRAFCAAGPGHCAPAPRGRAVFADRLQCSRRCTPASCSLRSADPSTLPHHRAVRKWADAAGGRALRFAAQGLSLVGSFVAASPRQGPSAGSNASAFHPAAAEGASSQFPPPWSRLPGP